MNNVHEWSSTPFHCYSAQFCATQQSTSVRDDQVFETTYRTSKHTHSFSKMRSQVGFTALRSWSCVLINGYCRSCFESSSGSCSFFKKVFYLSNSWNVRGWTVPSKVQPVVEDRRSKNHVQSMSWKACSPDKLENPVVWANNASPMILNVLCRISLCGVLKIFHPCLCAMSKSPLLNGSAMFALLGTLSSIWCNWYLLCHVQWAPMMLLSGWCLPVPLTMACFDASLSHSWI